MSTRDRDPDDLDTNPVAIGVRLLDIQEELEAWKADATHTARPAIETAQAFLELAAMNLLHPGRAGVTLGEAVREGAATVVAKKLLGEWPC